ncbi:alpha-ketoacid dehydrogenase subunit alpha/beta [Flavihumibacter petaseus]|uniref:3-methyl-2-oxobutanoate dehydrogenase (2-methylpropanoyl-transferring) n=1 Tax=Flavihumibacter petaseus NBRC 106054 TaxID=1220578 RepID=A0A0E9MZH7_9BACT|nr:thiamine pyrophosphate-dependent enzyme [Flavihumibacter petaseus]GAO42918.1 putative branched-chain alpha-keto acid dehydrogenase E1 component [Flavihumibacter petaseus NBRC 106054]
MENLMENDLLTSEKLSFDRFRDEVLRDYQLACESREASLMGRKEVLTGKAKFGIFGDGKEVAQIAAAKFFRPGDFRAGYYRDQTFAFATRIATIEQFFAQLYANPDVQYDPFSAGRQMNSHFATPNTDADGNWLPLARQKNSSSDMAPTASQMPRAVGLAYASKLFRQVPALRELTDLSNNGNEICFCTIGDASTSEGHFWEAVNAAGVMQIPLAIFVWDDGYGISVPKKLQTTKGSISELLKGFQQREGTNGLDIYRLKGWDYAGMVEVLEPAISKIRETHIPAVFHIEEITQPQGHSTSGSHERYKSPERLDWERQYDCNRKFKEWILENELVSEEELSEIELAAKDSVRSSRNSAWETYLAPIKYQVSRVESLSGNILNANLPAGDRIREVLSKLTAEKEPLRRDVMSTLHQIILLSGSHDSNFWLKEYYGELKQQNAALYNTHLYNEGPRSALKVAAAPVHYAADAPMLNGYEILNRYFDQLFSHNNKVIAFGEDVGYIGDVNQGFAGLQAKYGDQRISDTGIRELTIMGQGIGAALRGLRPIAEIQYLDYLLYGLQTLSDDLASTHYRTFGIQSCPMIVRTRGHRLEGIWHSGSPMGLILHSLRGVYVCVPRNMVQAAGMYNTLLESNDPAIMIECLNGYRLKERLPENLLEFRVPLGIPEIVKPGNDITLVSYGSTLRVVQDAANRLQEFGVDAEVIDVQTLLPFDIHHSIVASLKRTSRILFIDEDVPGGAAGYMYNQVMEVQGGYRWLDATPRTLTGKAHRPAYASDGDYFSKPNLEDIIDAVLEMMAE